MTLTLLTLAMMYPAGISIIVAELNVALEAVFDVYRKVVAFSVPLTIVTLAKVKFPREVTVLPSVTTVLPIVAALFVKKLLGNVAATL